MSLATAHRTAEGLLDDARAQLEAQTRINRRNVDRISDLENELQELQEMVIVLM